MDSRASVKLLKKSTDLASEVSGHLFAKKVFTEVIALNWRPLCILHLIVQSKSDPRGCMRFATFLFCDPLHN